MNQVKILFFATLSERAGTRQINLEIPGGSTVEQLKGLLVERFPGLRESMPNIIIAVNQEYAFDQDIVPPNADIALFPPVSGGSTVGTKTIIRLTDQAIDLDELSAQLISASTGALCIFSGVVRGSTHRGDPHDTSFLDYEAYQPMAEEKMQQVAAEIRQRWSEVEGIVIVQRTGRLFPGQPTVVIACSASHRDGGIFEATRYGIDRLKEIVPVWKKETTSEKEYWVEGDYHPGKQDRI